MGQNGQRFTAEQMVRMQRMYTSREELRCEQVELEFRLRDINRRLKELDAVTIDVEPSK